MRVANVFTLFWATLVTLSSAESHWRDSSSTQLESLFTYWGGCAGVLIHGDILLTAASCGGISARALVAASSRSSQATGAGAGFYMSVANGTMHPQFSITTKEYDFLVLKLSGWVEHEDFARLNDSWIRPTPFDTLESIGITTLQTDGESSEQLLGIQHQYVYPETCADLLPHEGFVISESLFCAQSTSGSVCGEQVGGPLFDENGILMGIKSKETGCTDDVPKVYARISAARHWIQEQICSLSDDPPHDSCPGHQSSSHIDSFSKIRIDIRHDEFSLDTSWSIFDSDGKLVGSSPPGYVVERSTLVSWYLNVPTGNYKFQIGDTYGDGLTEGDMAYYSATLLHEHGGRAQLFRRHNSDFGAMETIDFVVDPSAIPTASEQPTTIPTPMPTLSPSTVPNSTPTTTHTNGPTVEPWRTPTFVPTNELTWGPTDTPTRRPSSDPTQVESSLPSLLPTWQPTTSLPTFPPSVSPSSSPTFAPSVRPSTSPTHEPTHLPTRSPTAGPTPIPTESPSRLPTVAPTTMPTAHPTLQPTLQPSALPTRQPVATELPTSQPTRAPRDVLVTITISIAENPAFIAWAVTDVATGKVKAASPAGSYLAIGTVSREYFLLEGMYRFQTSQTGRARIVIERTNAGGGSELIYSSGFRLEQFPVVFEFQV